MITLQWRHNEHDSVSHHQPHDCLLNRLFWRRSNKTSKLRVTCLCAGNSPGTGEFPAQMASYARNVSIWWRHHETFWSQEMKSPTKVKAQKLTDTSIRKSKRTSWTYLINRYDSGRQNTCNYNWPVSQIPECICSICSIRSRNAHISVPNGTLWDMKQVHSGICEIGLLFFSCWSPMY